MNYLYYMDIKNKCAEATKMGYTYDSVTGKVFSHRGKEKKLNKGNRYIRFTILVDGKSYGINAHQYAFYSVYGYVPKVIDHINGDRCDNRICNLRESDWQKNQHNRRNVKGYSKISDNLYQSRIKLDNKLISLGYYKTEEEAHQAYLDGKKEYHT